MNTNEWNIDSNESSSDYNNEEEYNNSEEEQAYCSESHVIPSKITKLSLINMLIASITANFVENCALL